MPELAEVEYYRKEWDPGLGQAIRRVHLHPGARVFRETSAALIQRRLRGARLLSSEARGKQLLFRFSGGCWLGGHLGMSGRLRAADPGLAPGKHDHLALCTDAAVLVFTDPRMFGRVRFDACGENPPGWWRELPPGVLDPGFTRTLVAGHARRHARTPVKALLLDQAAYPGIGNWMADEICWRLRWPPGRLAGSLDAEETAALWKAVRQVSRQALRVIGDGWKDPPPSWLFPHRWEPGHSCPRRGCGVPLARASLRGRTACWCPRCQPES